MRVLVTGATGYIGGRLTRRLISDGHEVSVLSLRPAADALQTTTAHHAFRHHGDWESIHSAVAASRPEAVFHLAACQVLEPEPERIAGLVDGNVRFGALLLEAVSRTPGVRFLSAGSYAQHVDGEPFYPQRLYHATKQAFGDIVAFYVRARGVRAMIVELADTYGPSDPRAKIVNLIADAAAGGVTLDMSAGEQLMDLVHVDDVVSGFLAAERLLAQDPGLSGRTFALHAAEPVMLRDILDVWARATGRPAPVRLGARSYHPREMMGPAPTPGLPGWHAEIGLEEGLAQVAAGRLPAGGA
jgi:nucleoside-diphosphate-sugar epimerase